jgi:inner membrane protease ATP23
MQSLVLTMKHRVQECVRRRAIISVRAHPDCPDDETAERVVNEVFESCVKDTRPFDEASIPAVSPHDLV